MKEEYKELKEDVLDEEKAIDDTLKRLIEVKNQYKPNIEDYKTEPAMGTYLMNFYNGVENIIKRISKKYYFTIPSGENWHKELLMLSFNPPEGKNPIFNENIVSKLHPYRNFRHRFISGYGHQLKGEKMMDLISNINPLWQEIRKTISEFLEKI